MMGAAGVNFMPGGKRETGANPVRSRHCEPENSAAVCHCESEKARRCDDPKARKPACHWYRAKCPGHEELAVPKNARPGYCCTFLDLPHWEGLSFFAPEVFLPVRFWFLRNL